MVGLQRLGSAAGHFRMLTAHRAMVQIGGGPPALEGRTLKRWQSDAAAGEDPEREAEMKKERQEAWRQANALRKKFCTIMNCRGSTTQAFQSMFEKSEAYKASNLKATEAHRVFLFSAELWQESAANPWANQTVRNGKIRPNWPSSSWCRSGDRRTC